MEDNRISKVFVSSVAALLLLSSVVFLAGTQADASDDLQILDIFEEDGTPPPRENIEYDYIVKWRNVGEESYDATVVLYEPASNGDCSSSVAAPNGANLSPIEMTCYRLGVNLRILSCIMLCSNRIFLRTFERDVFD